MNLSVYKYEVEQAFTFNDVLFLEGDTIYLQHSNNNAPRLFKHDRELVGKINRDYYYDIKDKLKEAN